MSLKPPKKSDLSKSWMQPRRDIVKKLQPEYHLIITEGTDTEPAYFGAIRDIVNIGQHLTMGAAVFGESFAQSCKSSKHQTQSSISRKREIPTVFGLLLSP